MFGIVVDAALWAVVVWWLSVREDPAQRAAAWREAAHACQRVARWFGEHAIEAERRYWQEVQP